MTKVRTLVVLLPLPPKGLKPNARIDWRQRSRLTKKARGEARLWAMVALDRIEVLYNQRFPRCKAMTIQPCFYVKRRHDGDNLIAWLKAYGDGLQDSGLIVNDNGIRWLPPKQIIGKGKASVVFEIVATEEDVPDER